MLKLALNKRMSTYDNEQGINKLQPNNFSQKKRLSKHSYYILYFYFI